jgi:hypothetical protein
MNDTKDISRKIADTKIGIMLAVWHITEKDRTSFANRDEIASFFLDEYNKKITPETIRKHIIKIQKDFGKPFKIEGQHLTSNGDLQDTYRIGDDTVTYPETAYTLLDLATHGEGQRIDITKKPETIKRCAKELGFSEEVIESRINDAIRVKYIEIIPGKLGKEEFEFTELFSKQKPYIKELALIAKNRSQLQNAGKTSFENELDENESPKTDAR